MLKDYFNPDFSAHHQQRIYDCLSKIPRHLVFSRYSQARSYRAANCVKDNGRYSDVIFLYDGFFYIAQKEAFDDFKDFLKIVALDDKVDKTISTIKELQKGVKK